MDTKKNQRNWRDSKARIKLRIHFKNEEYSPEYREEKQIRKVKIVPMVSTMNNISIDNCRIEIAWSDSIEGEPIYVKKGRGAYDYERYDGILRHDPIRKKHVHIVDERKIHTGSEYPFPGFNLKINSKLTDEKDHLTISVVARNAQRVTETFYFRYSEGGNKRVYSAGTKYIGIFKMKSDARERELKEEEEEEIIEEKVIGEVTTKWEGYSLYRLSDSLKLGANVSLWRFFRINRHRFIHNEPYNFEPSDEHKKIVEEHQDEDEFIFNADELIDW